MRTSSCFVVALAALALVAGCSRPETTQSQPNKIPDKVKEALDKADLFDLYSLNPEREDEVRTDDFHRFKILGKTTVKDADTRKQLITALEKGVAENGVTAKCFHPGHGIRVVHDGKTYDLVICFQCSSAEVYGGDKKEADFHLTYSPQPVFDQVLKDAKVPLPEEKGK